MAPAKNTSKTNTGSASDGTPETVNQSGSDQTETTSNTEQTTSQEGETVPVTQPKRIAKKQRNSTIIASQNVVVLKALKYNDIVAVENFMRSYNVTNKEVLPLITWMEESLQFLVDWKFKSSGMDKEKWVNWREDDYLVDLMPKLKLLYPADTLAVSDTPNERIAEMKPLFQKLNIFDEETFQKCLLKLREIFSSPAAIALEEAEVRTLINKMYEQMYDKNWPVEKVNFQTKRFRERLKDDLHPETFEDVYRDFAAEFEALKEHVLATLKFFNIKKEQILHLNKRKDFKDNNNKRTRDAEVDNTPTDTGTKSPCTVCGRLHGRSCILHEHPDRNKEKVAWKDSTKGKEWAAKGEQTLPWRLTLNGRGWDHPAKPEKKEFKRARHDGELEIEQLNTLIHKPHTDTLTVHIQASHNSPPRECRALIDTGALHANYVSSDMVALLKKDNVVVSNTNSTVCDAFGVCNKAVGNIAIILTINNQNMCESVPLNTKSTCGCTDNHTQKIQIQCNIIESPYDLIIGRPTIQQYDLLSTLRYHLTKCNTCTESTGTAQSQTPAAQLAAIYQERQDEQRYVRESMRKYIQYDSDTEGIEIHTTDEDPYDVDQPKVDDEIPTEIHGSDTLKTKLTELCIEYRDIFSAQLRPKPADIPAYEIQCDIEKWNINKNRIPARVQSHTKQAETIRQVGEMLKNNVIRKSQASSYSQILLTPKPNNKWRFCVDYRNLNSTCTKQGWPIPNIKLMIQRIGHQSPRSEIFGKIDLTSGYHQAPLSQSSAALTAFITIIGVFEWLRVPMGLGGAPSYFQQVIATVVLVGLLHITCELYIDDIFIHAATEDEFLFRVRQVFERFRKHKITVNPQKCILGKDQIEFVGHLVSKQGITFTRERLDSVLQIPLPTHERGLKKFLGVVNYFHDHIRDHSTIVKPLQLLVHDYIPTKKITWNDSAVAAFEKIKESINMCPTLSFMNPDAPIYLHTDACDYGMGSYLFQLVDAQEVPVAFMSRAFNEREARWSTPEKECYAMYYSLVKFEYLLRDTYFVIRTDHKNLTYLNNSANEKVNRWKMKIQHFTFDIEYIPGPENYVADAFSRLVAFDAPGIKDLEENEQLCLLDAFKIPDDKYKKISTVHNSKIGHHGVERTMNKLYKMGEQWEYMRQHVRKYIKACPCCQKMSVLKIIIHTHTRKINIHSLYNSYTSTWDVHTVCTHYVHTVCTQQTGLKTI